MGTTASSPPADERDATTFGGLVPSGARARSEQTMVAVLGIEHFRDGAVAHVMVLTETPGLIDWAVESQLSVTDDLGTAHTASVLVKTQGLGQVATTIWLSPAIAPQATRLDFTVHELVRVTPPRGGEPTIKRPLSDGPWHVSIDLVPARTVVDPPEASDRRQRLPEPGSVPARSLRAFETIVPIGQARIVERVAICAVAAEIYADRWIVTLAALGEPDQPALAPAIGRARVSAWDDRGTRYRATPLQGTVRETWSEVSIEMVPPLDPDATALAIRISDIPRGNDIGPLPIIGPVLFGVQVPR